MMKRILMILTAVGLAGAARAGYDVDYNFDGATAINQTIVDGNSAGQQSTLGVAITPDDTLLGVRVYLNVTGGNNGDLYGYLTSPTGVRVDLVNALGTDGGHPLGDTDSGINTILDDGAGGSIQDVHTGSANSGPYQAAGTLGDFAAGSPGANGTWTLFLADTSLGGGNETLVSWGLELNVVPEPVTWALVIFGAALGLGAGVRRWRAARA